MQLIFIVHRARVCKFAYMLKFIYNIRINIAALLPSFTDVVQNTKRKKKKSVTQYKHFQLRLNKAMFQFLASSPTVYLMPDFHIFVLSFGGG